MTVATQKPRMKRKRRVRRSVRQDVKGARNRPNPLFALQSGTLATLDEIEAAALYEIEEDTFLSGEQADLIAIIPSLCAQIRAETVRAVPPSSETKETKR